MSDPPSIPITAFKAPLYVAWEVTHRCNARCLHCYSASGPDAACGDELTTNEALGVIDQLAEAGLMVLAFSGGEPLLRPDWRTLVRRAVAQGLGVNIGTNGSLITPAIADELAGLGLHSVTVSLDSHLPKTHDYIRQLPGLFPRTLRAINLLVERSLRVVVGFTPMRLNYEHGAAVVELALRHGATAANLSEYVPAGRGSIDLALTPGELHQVLQEWIGLREAFRGEIDVIWHDCRVGMLVPPEEERNYVGCGAGRLVGRICPDGTVTPCVFLPTSIGNLRCQSFRSMWARSGLLQKFRERQGHVWGQCGDCRYLATCGGCRAVAYAYSGGDPLAEDPHCWLDEHERQPLEALAAGEGLPV